MIKSKKDRYKFYKTSNDHLVLPLEAWEAWWNDALINAYQPVPLPTTWRSKKNMSEKETYINE